MAKPVSKNVEAVSVRRCRRIGVAPIELGVGCLGQRANATGTSAQRVESSRSSEDPAGWLTAVCRTAVELETQTDRLGAWLVVVGIPTMRRAATAAITGITVVSSERVRVGSATQEPVLNRSRSIRRFGISLLTDTARVSICDSGKGTAHASTICHLACHDFIAGFCAEFGNSGAGMHRGAFSLRRKRTSPRPGPRASKCRTGLASDPGKVTWGESRRQYASRHRTDSLQTRP